MDRAWSMPWTEVHLLDGAVRHLADHVEPAPPDHPGRAAHHTPPAAAPLATADTAPITKMEARA